MKKKLIIAALAISSVLAFAQTTGDSSSETNRRPMFGKDCHVFNAGTANEYESCCTFIFWIGFDCWTP